MNTEKMQKRYWENPAFGDWLKAKLIKYCHGQYSTSKIQSLSAGQFIDPIESLEDSRRDVLIKRVNERKTLTQVGAELGISYQRVWQLEQSAYKSLVLKLTNATDILLWEDKSLIASRCYDHSPIDYYLRSLPRRISNALKKGGYGTMYRLCRATPKDLLAVPGIGGTALRKIEMALKVFEQQNPQFFTPRR